MKIPLPSPLLLPYTVYICVCKRKSKWGFGNAGAGCFRWLAVSNLVCLLWAQSVDKLVNLIHSHLLLFIFKQKEKWTAPEFICGWWVPNFTAIHPKLLRCFNSERPKKKNQPHVGERVDSNPSAAFEELLAAMCVCVVSMWQPAGETTVGLKTKMVTTASVISELESIFIEGSAKNCTEGFSWWKMCFCLSISLI